MAYDGKFADNTPGICPAGVYTNTGENVVNLLKSYTVDDAINALKHENNVYKEEPSEYSSAPAHYPLPPASSHNYKGIYTGTRECLNNPVKTRYQTLINDLKETSYDSYWNKQLGKCRDATPGLPAGMVPELTTFGKPSPSEPSLKEVVFPSITHGTILYNSQIGHDMYKKTHNDYNPSERVSRGYLEPAFNPKKNYGMRTKYDARGIWFPCCTTWYDPEPECVGTEIQAKHHDRNRSQMGKARTPNHNIDNVPKGYRFGIKTQRPLYGMEELLKDPDIKPFSFKKDVADWVQHINRMRLQLKSRQGELDFRDFLDKLRYFDPELTGWLPLGLIYKVSVALKIYYDKNQLEPFLDYIGIIKENNVEYSKFIDLLNWQVDLPILPPLKGIPKERLLDQLQTQNQAAEFDWRYINNNCHPTAGITSSEFTQDPHIPPGMIQQYKENLGAETTAANLINPSIAMQYGVSHRDFFKPREKPAIRHIFEKMGYELTDEVFERLWSICQQVDKTDLVCVETFYNLILKSTIKLKELKPTGCTC